MYNINFQMFCPMINQDMFLLKIWDIGQNIYSVYARRIDRSLNILMELYNIII